MPEFHEVRFPTSISLGSRGGTERRTEVVPLGSGYEERNSVWEHSRRKYSAGYGIKTFNDLQLVFAFFEERRGRWTGFRWKDRLDFRSTLFGTSISPTDQVLGTGNGSLATFQLKKTYGTMFSPYVRPIKKPVEDTVRVAVAGMEKTIGTDFTVDLTTGIVTFQAGHIPSSGQIVTAGFEFDVPVRFDTDYLECDLSSFEAGAIPNIPIIEIRL